MSNSWGTPTPTESKPDLVIGQVWTADGRTWGHAADIPGFTLSRRQWWKVRLAAFFRAGLWKI